MTHRLAIGLDIGGTNIKGGVCDDGGRLRLQRSIETQAAQGYRHVVDRAAALVSELLAALGAQRSHVVAVGAGAPGPMSHARGLVFSAPNLPGWENVPLRADLAAATGLPANLENDANAAAFGEFIAGAAARPGGADPVRSMVLLTLGTGVGGGVILDGQLVRGHFDNAGEIGHMIVQPGGRPCPCGQRGCLERYASASSIPDRLREALSASASATPAAAQAQTTSETVLAAARAGDPVAARVWDEACRYLAIACVNLRHLLNPQLVVFGGGLVGAGAALLEPIRRHFAAESWNIAPDACDLALATLGNDAGMIGAALLALRQHPATS